jgi:BirA family biotin operon repressor/biotin-[acetyl-CoA-carboxylase] ligase
MVRDLELVRLLADGGYSSGEALAARLGVTRAAVWKALGRVRERWGLEVESVRGHGYRLAAPLELLDAESILAGLGAQARARVARLEIHTEIDSTNARLMAQARVGAPSGTVCLAERQSAGRGRRGRTWVSPFGANLYLSILWRFPLAPAALGGVSLAAGVAVARAVEGAGAGAGALGLALKWPNDLLWQGRKLGGLLLEVAGEAQGPSCLVVGVGLDLRISARQGSAIDQPWTDLASALGGSLPGRNLLAARLIESLAESLVRYGELGLAPFLADWERLDGLRGHQVALHLGERVQIGEHAGIAPDGGLKLLTERGIETFHSGEVSLRPAGDRTP